MRRLLPVVLGALSVGAVVSCGPVAETATGNNRFQQRLRPTHSDALFSYETGATLASHDSAGGRIKVHYATDTDDAVPLEDSDSSGVPDYVEQVADTFDLVLAFYIDEAGFREPIVDTTVTIADNGGDERFDVYLVDFAHMGDGVFGVDGCLPGTSQCAGHMAMENDFVGYGYPSIDVAINILSSHEFFHAIQAAYDSEHDSWWTEATATWGEEIYDPSQNDFEGFLHGYFEQPDRSMDVPPLGSVDSFSYGLAIWPQFLSERFDRDIVRQTWEALIDGTDGIEDPEPLSTVDRVLGQYNSTFADAFAEFAVWNLYTDAYNIPALSYDNGAAYPLMAMQWLGVLPLEQESLRVYHASTQYLRATVDGQTEVTAGFLEEVEGGESLRLAMVKSDGYTRSDVTWIEDHSAEYPTTVEVGSDTHVILAVINTAMEGRSLKPVLCFGSPEEVHTCRFGEGSGGDPPEEKPKEKSESCAALSSGHGMWGLCLLMVWWRRRSLIHL